MRPSSLAHAKARLLPPCAVAVLLYLVSGQAAAAPEMALVNGKIFTGDPDHPYAEAVAIEAGRFSAVGTNAQIRKWLDRRHGSSTLGADW